MGSQRTALWQSGTVHTRPGGGREARIASLSLLPPGPGKALPIGWFFGARTLQIAEPRIESWVYDNQFPDIPNPLRADFDQPASIELHGYRLSDEEVFAGQDLDLTLLWRPLSDHITTIYEIRTMLVGDDGEIVTTGEYRFGDESRPTNSWRDGEVIVDTHTLSVPADSLPGAYKLMLAIYDPASNQNLPVLVEGERQADDTLQLTILNQAP